MFYDREDAARQLAKKLEHLRGKKSARVGDSPRCCQHGENHRRQTKW